MAEAEAPPPSANGASAALELLQQRSGVLASARGGAPLLRDVAELLVPAAFARCSFFTASAAGQLGRVAGAPEPIGADELLRDEAAAARVMGSGETEVLEASVTAPIVSAGAVIGAVAVAAAPGGRAFSAAEARSIEEVGLRAGELLAQQRLLADAQLVAGRLQRLQGTTAALSRAVSLEQVAEVIIGQVRDATGAFAASVSLIEGDQLHALRRVGPLPALDQKLVRLPLSSRIPAAAAARSGQPLFAPHFSPEGIDELTEAPLETFSGLSVAALPLIAQGRSIGALVLGFGATSLFPDEEREFLLAFAEQSAQALSRAQLYEAEHKARATAAQLQAVTAALANARSPTEVAQLAVAKAVEALGARSGVVGLLIDAGTALSFVATAGDVRPEVIAPWQRHPVDARTPLFDAARLGHEVWLESAAELARHYPDLGQIAPTSGQAFCALPMQVEGRRLGVLGLAFADERRLDSNERAFLLAIARQCAQAFERARLIGEAQQAHELLQAALKRLPIGVVVAEQTGRISVYNDEAARLYSELSALHGTQGDPLQGFRADGTPVPPDEWPMWRAMLRGETVIDEEMRVRAADGREVILRSSAVPVPGADGSPRAAVVTLVDVSEQKRAEERERFLSEAGVLLSASLDADAVLDRLVTLSVPRIADGCVMRLWRDGELVVVPSRVGGLSTAPAEEDAARRVGRSGVSEQIEDLGEIRSGMVVPLRGRGGVLGVLSFCATRSRRLYARTDLRLAEDLAGRASLAIDNARLYGESERVREELERTTASLRALIARSPLAILVLDINGIVRSWNPAAERLLGWTAQEAIGTFLPYVNEEKASDYRRNIARVREGEVLSGLPVVRHKKDGTAFPARLWASPVPMPGGEVLVLALLADITEEKRAEEERAGLLRREQQARAHAEEATRLKDEFLATLSHEMRTPLTAILGWVRMLRVRGEVPPQLDHAVATIDRNARAQLQMVEDLLDVSRIVAGKLRLSLADIDLAQLLRAAAEAVQPTAELKGVTLKLTAVEAQVAVRGDPDRLQQVAWNLLANAIKFTPAGGVVEGALADEGAFARLTVRDSGRGIAAAFMPFVFTRFRQADGGTTRLEGGLGLGLAISRHLVEMHGGTIEAASEGEGRGATFTVRLPKQQPASAALPEEPADPSLPPPVASTGLGVPSLAGVRVLAVEDDDDARELLGLILEGYGASVTLASSAREGLAAAAQGDFDAVLSDVSMPTEDGYSFIRKLRASARNAQVPAAALTANVRLEDRERAIVAGFQMHVGKPIDPTELAQAVQRLARGPK